MENFIVFPIWIFSFLSPRTSKSHKSGKFGGTYTYCSIFPLFCVTVMISLMSHRADGSWLYFHVVRTLLNVKNETLKIQFQQFQSLFIFQSFIISVIFSFFKFLKIKTRILEILSAGQKFLSEIRIFKNTFCRKYSRNFVDPECLKNSLSLIVNF